MNVAIKKQPEDPVLTGSNIKSKITIYYVFTGWIGSYRPEQSNRWDNIIDNKLTVLKN